MSSACRPFVGPWTDTIGERLRVALRGAHKAVKVSVREHQELEDWVSDDGRLVLIGEAAHPFPVSAHPLENHDPMLIVPR